MRRERGWPGWGEKWRTLAREASSLEFQVVFFGGVFWFPNSCLESIGKNFRVDIALVLQWNQIDRRLVLTFQKYSHHVVKHLKSRNFKTFIIPIVSKTPSARSWKSSYPHVSADTLVGHVMGDQVIPDVVAKKCSGSPGYIYIYTHTCGTSKNHVLVKLRHLPPLKNDMWLEHVKNISIDTLKFLKTGALYHDRPDHGK